MDLRAQTDNQSGGGAAPELVNKAASTVQNMLDTSDQAVDEAAEKVKQVTGRLRTGQDKVVDAVHRATEAAGEYREKAAALAQMPEQWMQSASESIRAQPIKAVAIAFVAGWVYGRFFR